MSFFFIIGLWECQGGVGRGGIEGGWVGDIGRLELFPSFCVALLGRVDFLERAGYFFLDVIFFGP